jgi:diguanylate cyclase (GGDEF)-like protein/PAS domain S-box-containing protein
MKIKDRFTLSLDNQKHLVVVNGERMIVSSQNFTALESMLMQIGSKKTHALDAVNISADNEHYRFLVEISSDAILVHREGRLVLVNAAALLVLGGYDIDQLIGRPITDFVLTRRRTGDRGKADAHAESDKHAVFVKCKLMRLDGTHFDAEVATNSVSHNDNTTTVQLVVRKAAEQTQPEYHLSYLAQYDLLTQLPNRSQFRDRLRGAISRAHRYKQIVGVMFVGLDQFKRLNTTYGQATGDLVLKHLAERLKDCIRGSDTVARLGGDEFSLILEGLSEREGALVVARRVQEKLSEPVVLDNREIHVAASIGITVYPLDTGDLDQLWRYADVALYYAKDSGGNNHQLYSPEIEKLSRRDESRQARTRQQLALLTAREREVMNMLIAGKANKMIAYLLGTSTRTIENHRAKIMDKMEVDSLPELVRSILDLKS